MLPLGGEEDGVTILVTLLQPETCRKTPPESAVTTLLLWFDSLDFHFKIHVLLDLRREIFFSRFVLNSFLRLIH